MIILKHKPLINRKISLSFDYGITLIEKGTDVAFYELFKKKVYTLHYYLDEEDMNELVLQLMFAAPFGNHKE